MGMLLGFAPFVAFAVAANVWNGETGLIVGAGVAALLLAKELMSKRRPKLLEWGTFLMFAGLLAWSRIFPSELSVLSVRLRVDIGLLCVILISIAIGKPFTLQYGRERVSTERASTPQFAKIHFVITAVWALAFTCIVAADALMLYVPSVPMRMAIAVTIFGIVGAYKFSGWYPSRAVRQ